MAGPLPGAEEAPREFARLETTKGVIYEGVKVTKAEPDGLRITHKNGVAKVLFLDLKDFGIAEKFGYDFAAGTDFATAQQEQAAAVPAAATHTAQDLAVADRQSRQRAAGAEDTRKLEAGLDKRAVRVECDSFQQAKVGLIGSVKVGHVIRWEEKPGSMAKTIPVWQYAPPVDAVLSGYQSPMQGTEISRSGLTRDYIAWSGKAWDIGTVTYITVTGASRTVKHFTADRAAALAYFKGR
jgi:hypothetical protein